jgi:hypothetical protein
LSNVGTGSRNSADGENSKFYLRGFLKTEKFFSFPCQFRTDDGFQQENNVLLEPTYINCAFFKPTRYLRSSLSFLILVYWIEKIVSLKFYYYPMKSPSSGKGSIWSLWLSKLFHPPRALCGPVAKAMSCILLV